MLIAAIAALSLTSCVCVVATPPDDKATSPSCPPGFMLQGNGSNCICVNWPNRIVKCDEDSKNASMRIDYCMTYDNETGEIKAGACLRGFFRSDSYKFNYPLPNDMSALDEYVCAPLNRKGKICGECEDGYAVSPLLITVCANCSDGTSNSWIKFLAFVYLPITIGLLIIVVFGISVVSGPVNAFIFFSQVTTSYLHFVFIEATLKAQESTSTHFKVSTPAMVLDGFYSLTNLNFFNNFIPRFCLTKHLNRLEAISLEYASAAYLFVFLVLIYICIQLHARDCRFIVCCWKPFHKFLVYFRRRVDPKTSSIDAFATLILLSYVKIVTVTNFLILASYIYNDRGEKFSTPVVYYDPSIPYFHKEHLPHVLFAIVIFFNICSFSTSPTSVLPNCLFSKVSDTLQNELTSSSYFY